MKILISKKRYIPMALLAIFLFTANPAESQTIPKKPCLEHFTSSTCPPCAAFNPVLNGILSQFPDQYVLIRYQMYWPGSGDPYYFAESKKRRDYYTITGVPGLTYNGKKQIPYAQYFSKERLDSLVALKTGVAMDIAASMNADKIVTATVTISPEIAYPASLKLIMVAMEKVTTQNAATNGEKSFEHVAMGFMPDGSGITLGALTPGTPVNMTYSIDMKTTHMETANDILVAAFIQNNTDKEIYQSECVKVEHPFTDYKVDFVVYDNDYNPVPTGKIFMPVNGQELISGSGLCHYDGIFPGTYTYTVNASGYDGTEDELTVTNSDLALEIMIEKPDLYFYEDFDLNTIPDGWTVFTSNGNYINSTNFGTILYYKLNEGDDENYMLFPPTNLTQGAVVSIRAGNALGSPIAKLGTVTTVPAPGSDGTAGVKVTGFTELGSVTISKADGIGLYSYRLGEGTGTNRLAFKFIGDAGDYAELDKVMIIEENPGVKVAFWVTDQNDQPLKNTSVTFMDKSLDVNGHGYATYRDTDPGNYPYIVSYKGEVVTTGTLEVDGEMVKHIIHNTSGINTREVLIPISLYPNPAKNQFVVTGVTRATVTIMNLNGQEIDQRIIDAHTPFMTTNLENGIYLVMIREEERTVQQKLVIIK